MKQVVEKDDGKERTSKGIRKGRRRGRKGEKRRAKKKWTVGFASMVEAVNSC